MDTSDRQVAETGRNRELGLIPAMVMAVVATLSGAGVSFAPLYERIWGGMMLHPNCPAIGRMTYYLSGQATDDYGACVTSPLWFMTVTALSVVAILCLTVAGVQGFSRHRLCSVFSVLIAAVAGARHSHLISEQRLDTNRATVVRMADWRDAGIRHRIFSIRRGQLQRRRNHRLRTWTCGICAGAMRLSYHRLAKQQ
ncbi:putative membrane spanning protein [Bifidobacterium longum subsp. longum]|nr:putative membrane spanning protein [Bifidobacterium longum subsp. longum]